MITLIVAAKRKKGMSRDAFVKYWIETHAPLVKSVPEFIRHVKKYALYPLSPDGQDMPALGFAPEYDGVGELWFECRETMMEAFREPRYLEIILPDEGIFLDRDACLTFVTDELIMKDFQR